MATDQNRIQELEAAYRRLWEQHQDLKDEIKHHFSELTALRDKLGVEPVNPGEPVSVTAETAVFKGFTTSQATETETKTTPSKGKSGWEQYIGEQLLSKIGIAILVIGVGIGVKYAIDHRMLSAGFRIFGGYLVATVLGFFAWQFRRKYEGFSAILISGAMTVSYFMTFAAYDFYHLFPYWMAFLLLLLITGGTVFAALRYNQVIIAHVGLIGAYVLPIVISANSNQFIVYLTYVTVINCGILVISFLRNWKSLYHVAFAWTVLVTVAWFFRSDYNEWTDASKAVAFILLSFALFHCAAIAYPWRQKQATKAADLFLLIPNVLACFAMGQYVLATGGYSATSCFLFGTAVAAAMGIVGRVLWAWRPDDNLLKEVPFATAISTFTLALLYQVEGEHLLFVWVVELCLLVWLALKTKWTFLYWFTTILIVLASLNAVVAMMSNLFWFDKTGSFFSNSRFNWLLMAFLIPAAGYELNRRVFSREESQKLPAVRAMIAFTFIGIFLLNSLEITHYFSQISHATFSVSGDGLSGFGYLRSTVSLTEGMILTAFCVVYWGGFLLLNHFYYQLNHTESWIRPMTVSVVLAALIAMTVSSADLHKFLLAPDYKGVFLLGHYLAFAAMGAMLYHWRTQRNAMLTILHLSLLWMLSLELLQWFRFSGNANAYKLALSILWAMYAIYLLFEGARRSVLQLRITAMVVLGITLLKLFVYDLSQLSMLSKSVLCIGLGGLFLVGAYFYLRYTAEEKAE